MSRNVTVLPAEHATQKATAAALLAADEVSDEEIAQQVGVDRRTLARWKHEPAFARMVRDATADLADARQRIALAHSLARLSKRMVAKQARWEKLQTIIAERAADPTMQGVPGGSTGLLVRQYRVIGRGKDARTVEEYVVDTGLLDALLKLEREAAAEMDVVKDKADKPVQQTNVQVNVSTDPYAEARALLAQLKAKRLAAEQAALPPPDVL